jgi:hypothetical protein
VDQWALLNIVMAGQVGGRGALWEKAFIRVNLHPHHKIPIDVWLSRIQDKIVAAGGTEKGADPYGIQFLKIIKVPDFLEKLTQAEQSELRELVCAADFDWSYDKQQELPSKYRKLLNSKKGIWLYFKFKNSMVTALEKGLVLPGELTPGTALDRAREAERNGAPATHQMTQKEQNKINMRDVGHSSYSRLGRPGLSQMEKFKAICLHRSRFERKDKYPSRGTDLMCTADQERRIFNITPQDATIGAMLDGVLDINLGKRHAARQINLLGEAEGVACIVNDPKRLLLLQQAATLSQSMAHLKQSRAAAKKNKGAAKSKKAAEKQAAENAESGVQELLKESAILPRGPDASMKLTVPALKEYVRKHKLKRFLPAVPKKESRPNLINFLQELCTQVSLHNQVHNTSHEESDANHFCRAYR